jgi:hypothetical protein
MYSCCKRKDIYFRQTNCVIFILSNNIQGWIQDFKLGGVHLIKKWGRAEGGANIFGVFRVKNHDFTPNNLIFSNFWGGRAPGVPPLDPPLVYDPILLK